MKDTPILYRHYQINNTIYFILLLNNTASSFYLEDNINFILSIS